MPLDFPDSPTPSQTYTSGNQTWQWDGAVWKLITSVAPTGPTGPTGPAGPTGATGPAGIDVVYAATSSKSQLTTSQGYIDDWITCAIDPTKVFANNGDTIEILQTGVYDISFYAVLRNSSVSTSTRRYVYLAPNSFGSGFGFAQSAFLDMPGPNQYQHFVGQGILNVEFVPSYVYMLTPGTANILWDGGGARHSLVIRKIA